jgi:hypothetical protein
MSSNTSLALALRLFAGCSLLAGCGGAIRTVTGPSPESAELDGRDETANEQDEAEPSLAVTERSLEGAWVLTRYSEGGEDRTKRAIRDNGGSPPAWTLSSGGRLVTDQGEGAWRLDGRQLYVSLPDYDEQMLLVEGVSASALILFHPSYRYPYSTFARK